MRRGSIHRRIEDLEASSRGGPCPECGFPPDARGCIVMVDKERPEESFEGDPDERCGRCGRLLYTVIEVVYEGGEEAGERGGGVRYP